jgi:hypothetical protein
MNIGEKRVSVKDRRSGADRRDILLPKIPLSERRCGAERRSDSDRRVSKVSFKSTKKSKRDLICSIFKNGRIFGGLNNIGLKQNQIKTISDPREKLMKRTHRRLSCKIPLEVLNCQTQRFVLATARNYSDYGMYLESEFSPEIDSGIAIKMEKHSFGLAKPQDIPKYHSRVIWRKALSNDVNHARFGIGVKHCNDLEEFLKLFSL